MDVAAKAKKSQALIDSIEELIALEADVSLATQCFQQQREPEVMVPLTEVALMHGSVAGESIMMGLGQDYFVERTPEQAREVLRRRMADLSEQARVLREGTLLAPKEPAKSVQGQTRRKKGDSDTKKTWAKGFLSSKGSGGPTKGHLPPKRQTVPPKEPKEAADGGSSRTPTEIKFDDSEGQEHVVEVEDGQEAPIMEIREWLDESGKQTSVDVTDLGKVLGTTQKAVKAGSQSMAKDASRSTPKNEAAASPPRPVDDTAVGTSGASDLDSVLARLEAQEAKAESQASNPTLGPNWKKGFLDGGAKPSPPKPSVSTPDMREIRSDSTSGPAVPRSNETAAFRESVVEKPNAGVGPVLARNSATTAGAGAGAAADVSPPARVSRFKARRQGL
ncbi:unnamed protein product [Ectocarpus sp. 6 AP-2014]